MLAQRRHARDDSGAVSTMTKHLTAAALAAIMIPLAGCGHSHHHYYPAPGYRPYQPPVIVHHYLHVCRRRGC